MKPSHILVIIAIILIIAIYMSRNKIKQSAAKVSTMIRGLRNNNPGNIRITRDANGKQTFWTGEILGSDKDFKTFKSMAYGYRAIFVTLNSYFNKGFNTLEKILNRYAPGSENDTFAYIKAVAAQTGVNPTEILSFENVDVIKKIVSAISRHENGVNADMSLINEGYSLFK